MISCSETNKLENINKILLFGDSLMSGYGLKENQALSIILENDLKKFDQIDPKIKNKLEKELENEMRELNYLENKF